MTIPIRPIYAVAVRYAGEKEAIVMQSLISSDRELICAEYDAKRFGSPPDDCVYFLELTEGRVIVSDPGTLQNELLPCPNCPDQGWWIDVDPYTGDPIQVQCEFCYTEPNSVFNSKAR